jgi:hypothetical protein
MENKTPTAPAKSVKLKPGIKEFTIPGITGMSYNETHIQNSESVRTLIQKRRAANPEWFDKHFTEA